jgi:hypothetical protein
MSLGEKFQKLMRKKWINENSKRKNRRDNEGSKEVKK